jgi:hypothetical protein
MGKLISEGDFEAEGMIFHYRYYRDGRLPQRRGYNCYLESFYGTKIFEVDHGLGLEHAINLAKIEINIRKQNAEKAKESKPE